MKQLGQPRSSEFLNQSRDVRFVSVGSRAKQMNKVLQVGLDHIAEKTLALEMITLTKVQYDSL